MYIHNHIYIYIYISVYTHMHMHKHYKHPRLAAPRRLRQPLTNSSRLSWPDLPQTNSWLTTTTNNNNNNDNDNNVIAPLFCYIVNSWLSCLVA